MEITYFWVCAFWKKFFNLFLILQFKLLWEPKITLPRMIYGSSGKFWLTNNLLLKEEKGKKKYSTMKNSSNWFHVLLLIQSKTHVLQEKIQFPEVLHNISFWCFTLSPTRIPLFFSLLSLFSPSLSFPVLPLIKVFFLFLFL